MSTKSGPRRRAVTLAGELVEHTGDTEVRVAFVRLPAGPDWGPALTVGDPVARVTERLERAASRRSMAHKARELGFIAMAAKYAAESDLAYDDLAELLE